MMLMAATNCTCKHTHTYNDEILVTEKKLKEKIKTFKFYKITTTTLNGVLNTKSAKFAYFLLNTHLHTNKHTHTYQHIYYLYNNDLHVNKDARKEIFTKFPL